MINASRYHGKLIKEEEEEKRIFVKAFFYFIKSLIPLEDVSQKGKAYNMKSK